MSDLKHSKYQQQDQNGSPEREADLSQLDSGELEVEKERIALRDTRREQREKQKRSTIDNAIVVAVALVSLAIIVVGLIRNDEGTIRVGVVALCAIGGASIFQILRAGARDR